MTPMRTADSFRPAHEARAAVAWALVCGHALALATLLQVDRRAAAGAAAFGAAMMLWRLSQACALWRFRLALRGHAVATLPVRRFEQRRDALDGALWLGWGYRWQQQHTQLCHEVLKRPRWDLDPPRWYCRLKGQPGNTPSAKGLAWVHGLAHERDVVVPFSALEGHTAVLAITGALKTVLARLLVYQLARRGDTVIVLDPKGDRGLEAVCRDVTTRLGEPGRFLKFHPAFASQSFRYDALANWERETQIASRLQLLMGGDTNDHFSAFVWMTVTDLVRAMKRVGRRVTLRSLLLLLRSPEAREALGEAVLTSFFAAQGMVVPPPSDGAASTETSATGDWGTTRSPESGASSETSPPARRPGSGDGAAAIGRRSGEGTKGHGHGHGHGPGPGRARPAVGDPSFRSPRLAALARVYQTAVPADRQPADITGLLAALATDREWFAKMVVGLTPILTRLSSGDLEALLSPDHDDLADERPVYTARKLIQGRHVVYFGLDALSDTAVAESLAALVLADLAGTAGESYNRADGDGPMPKVHVVCDEWGDLVCEPVIQLANKGRGVGIVLYLFGQTVSDLVVKLGDVARAKRVLGNMNNFIVGATSDSDTLEFMARKFGETVVRRTTLSQGTGQKTEDAGLEYAATRQTSVTEQAHERVPSAVLMGLPDLQYFAIVNRAEIFKGRIPVLTFDEARSSPPVDAGSRAGRGGHS